jgi:hypothetical protein
VEHTCGHGSRDRCKNAMEIRNTFSKCKNKDRQPVMSYEQRRDRKEGEV